jgi:hypothetical protein
MNKINRLWLAPLGRYARGALVLGIVLFCLAMPTLAAAKPVTGTFVGKGLGHEVAFSHGGKAHNDWAGVLRFKIDDGPEVSVFCIQIDVRVRAGDRYHSDGPVLSLPNGCKIRYLLDKYPASSAKDADEAAARQMAIWVFSDNVDPATIQDAKVRARAIALVNEAKQAQCPKRRTEAPDLFLDPPSANASAGQTVAYTVRAGPADAGATLTVNVTGPAVLSNENGLTNGQQQQNVTLDGQGQAHFWVTGTGAGQTGVSVALPYKLEAGTVFSQLDDNAPSQRLVMAESRSLVAKASAQLNWAAGAPQPSPTQEVGGSTAVPAAPTPVPTHRPSKKPTATPESNAQPTETVVAGEQATAVPTAASEATPTVGAEVEAGGAATTAQPSPETAPAGAAAAPRPIPRALPNTADAGDRAIWPILVSITLLLIAGWFMRRRARAG